MLTENDARALLAQAADTIEVGPATPVEPVRRRAWPVLAAAAATLVAGVGVWAGVSALDTDAAPAPSVDTPLDQGTVPSVFGHRRAAATRLLEEAGLEVRVVERPACDPPGQATGTLPSTGVRMEPGSVVTLQVAAFSAVADCFVDLTVPWQLLGLATGELESPSLLQGPLTTYLDGERQAVADASDPEAWGSPSALDALEAAVDWSPDVPREWRTLESQEPGCDGDAFVPNVISGTTLQRYAIEYDDPDAPCVQLTVAGEFGKRPVAVAVETAGLEVGDPDPTPEPVPDAATVPAVFGLTEGEAVAALRRAGVTNLVTEAESGCFESGRALRTEPAAGRPLDASQSVRLTITGPVDGECLPGTPGTDPDVLWSLLDFARGSGPASFANEVITSVDGDLSTETDPDTLRTWASGSPLEALASVAADTRTDLTDERAFRSGSEGSFPAECEVGAFQPATLPTGFDDPETPVTTDTSRTWFAHERDGAVRACLVLDVSLDDQGRIDALAVRTVDPDGLLPVLAAQPENAEVSDLVSVLVAFAKGEWTEPPDLADEVRLYDDGDYLRTASAEELVEPTAWLVCDPAVRDTCVGSALEALAYAVGEVPFRSTEQVPAEAPPGTVAVVSVGPPQVSSCQPRGTVMLYVDVDEQIVGVDVANAPVRICGEEGLVPPE